jgi:DNA helicase-2/ATP-dependent DNA helicase PcrA
MRSPDDALYVGNAPYTDDKMKDIYWAYEKYKDMKKYIEFDDLLNMVCDIFVKDSDFLEKYQDKFQYILVDEFQDVSLNQAMFLKYLSAKNNNLFVVGDGCQAIYRFRGGISKYLLEFDTEWENTEIVNLNTNYRCSKDIIDTANLLATNLPESENKHYVEPVANRECMGKPVFKECDNAVREAKYVVDKITEIVNAKKYSFKDIAILARTNAQLQMLENVFAHEKVPYITSDGSTYVERPEIKLITSYLALAFDESDEAFKFIYNKPNRWLSKQFLERVMSIAKKKKVSLYKAMFDIDRREWKWKNGIDEIHNVVNRLRNRRFENVGRMIKYLRRELNIDDFVSRGKLADDGSYSEQIESIDNFEDTCRKFATYDELKTYLKTIDSVDMADEGDRVSLLTIHKAKGLEFPVVFIVGCSEGLLPHSKSTDIDDEMRLFYVGITRAMDKLFLTSTLKYNDKPYDTSHFIDLISNKITKE